MKPTLLLLVTSDPRVSGRPAEAIRIGAGVGTWQKVDVTLYLRGPAIGALAEWVDDLVDEDNFTRYLPIVAEWGRPVLVEKGHAALDALGQTTIPWLGIDDTELAELVRRTTYALRF